MGSTKLVLVDSNIWIGFYKQDDTLHTDARALLQSFEDKGCHLLITTFILQEVFTILRAIAGHDIAMKFYRHVMDHKRIHRLALDIIFIDSVIKYIDRHELPSKLSLVDASLLFLTQEVDAQLFSFDKRLMSMYKEIV